MKLLHLKIFVAVWIVIILVGFYIPKELLTANLYSARVMNLTTFLWISSCFLAFWMGTFIERSLYTSDGNSVTISVKMPIISADKLEKILRTFKALLFIVSAVIFIRVIWCVLLVGSLKQVFLIGFMQPIFFRFAIWQQTTIHGMGALSDIIVACTIFAYALFALMKKYRDNSEQIIAWGYSAEKIKSYYLSSVRMLSLALFVLAIYFLLGSERLVLVMGFLGGLIAYYLVLRRFPLKNFAYITIFFLLLWIVIEGYLRAAFTPTTFGFVVEYAMDRLMLYLVPGLRNVDTMVNYLPNHTYGFYTFNFIPVTFKLDFLSSVTADIYGNTAYQVKPGLGAIPVFGTAYADYGVAGLLYFVILGFIYQRLYRSAILKNNFLAIQVYAYFLVALIISFMPFLLTLARFWVNVLSLYLINKAVSFGNLPSLKTALLRKHDS